MKLFDYLYHSFIPLILCYNTEQPTYEIYEVKLG